MKLQFVATLADDYDLQLEFALDTTLAVSGLKLPKAETGMEKEANFLLKHEVLSKMAGILGGLLSLDMLSLASGNH